MASGAGGTLHRGLKWRGRPGPIFEPPISGRRLATAVLVGASLLVIVAGSAIAASMDAPELLLVIPVGIGSLAAALLRPNLLFYAYCAAIPLNFALPPGPLGTIARIAGLAFFALYLIRRPDVLRPSTIPPIGWVLLGWATLSCLWAIDIGAAFSTWLSFVQLFAITVLIASLVAATPGIARYGIWSYAISAAVTAAIGTMTYLQSTAVFLGRAAAFSDQDPAMFASLLVPAAIFFMWEVQSRSSPIGVRLAAAIGVVVCIVALALSGTRSAWVGIVVAVVTWILLQRDRRQLASLVALALGVVVLIALVPGAGDWLVGRTASGLETGGAGRTDIWVVGLSIFAAAPLLGVGLGNFPIAFTPYAIAQAPAEAALNSAIYAGRAPHNVLLGSVVEMGVVGGVLLVGFFALALRQPVRDGFTNMVRVALFSLLVQSLFLDILLQKQLWLFLAIAFGLAASNRQSALNGPEVWAPSRLTEGSATVGAAIPDGPV